MKSPGEISGLALVKFKRDQSTKPRDEDHEPWLSFDRQSLANRKQTPVLKLERNQGQELVLEDSNFTLYAMRLFSVNPLVIVLSSFDCECEL